MSIFLVLLALLSALSIAATLREVRADGHRARPVDADLLAQRVAR